MSRYFEAREAIDPSQREAALMRRLPEALRHARAAAPAIARQLEGIDPDAVVSRAQLARIPVLRKSELLGIQQAHHESLNRLDERERVFGGFSSIGWGQALRVFASPGPIYEPEGSRPDYWGFARALHAAGIRRGDLVHNCFSYHFTPAGAMMETAAHALGCTVFPGGVGQTEQQVQAMADLRPAAYTGTPGFLRIILEKAQEMDVSLSLRCALVSGEAFPPSLQAWLAERGVQAFQAYGSADLGMVAYETEAREGMVVNEDLILEIVRPGTGDPLPDGEVGEIVVTSFNPDYPLLRFGTGDLSAIMPGISACGRSNVRIRGWMGRADQTTKVRGMFIHPGQVAQVMRRHPGVRAARLEVMGKMGSDQLVLKVVLDAAGAGVLADIGASVRELTKLRAEVVAVAPDSLPNDGKVIDDQRSYE